MKKNATSEIKRGQSISFRIPSDTPDHILKQLQMLKETEKRNFSGKIAEYVLDGVSNAYSRERETITVTLPRTLSKIQRDWLKHEHSEALLGSIIYQLITDPIRATSLLASLNSQSSDIDQALYLQEENEYQLEALDQVESITQKDMEITEIEQSDTDHLVNLDDEDDDDLARFNWESIHKDQENNDESHKEAQVESYDDLLGDFLAQMNK